MVVAAPTSAVSAEVKNAPPVTQTREQKLVEGMKQAWAKLNDSDKNLNQTGREFGKFCSGLRNMYKKPGSRKGQGFEAIVKANGISFQKARYWADVYEGKKKHQYWGGSKPKPTDKEKDSKPKPTPFTLVAVTESEQTEMVKAVSESGFGKGAFSRYIYQLVAKPSNEEVKWLIVRCLGTFDKLQDQLDLLAEVRGWLDKQCFSLQEQIEAGVTTVELEAPRRAVAYLDSENAITGEQPNSMVEKATIENALTATAGGV